MKRTRDYYVTLGFGTPYRWAHYLEVPFTPLKKPLSESRVGIVTTAAPYDPEKGDQGPGAAYNSAAKFYTVYSGDTSQEHDLRIRSEEHTSELQSLMRISYAVFCLKKKKTQK